eukprot:TRINITY_DN3362_c0_g1_i1.p1 TRINITY_DN3362_c0_g1~~TRINITY_DN3362_c0_g1_i1.p1  ORF type:complete len:266 (+),score=55.67 TRINITY_DN3362_c0_g1_i1:249-1046(+)
MSVWLSTRSMPFVRHPTLVGNVRNLSLFRQLSSLARADKTPTHRRSVRPFLPSSSCFCWTRKTTTVGVSHSRPFSMRQSIGGVGPRLQCFSTSVGGEKKRGAVAVPTEEEEDEVSGLVDGLLSRTKTDLVDAIDPHFDATEEEARGVIDPIERVKQRVLELELELSRDEDVGSQVPESERGAHVTDAVIVGDKRSRGQLGEDRLQEDDDDDFEADEDVVEELDALFQTRDDEREDEDDPLTHVKQLCAGTITIFAEKVASQRTTA